MPTIDPVTARLLGWYAICFLSILALGGGVVFVVWATGEAATTRNEQAEAARAGAYDPHKEKE